MARLSFDWPEERLALLRVLGGDAGETRLVGGAVRDTLAGLPVKDIDLATRLLPEEVMARAKAAGLKVVPTGIAHGTVTVALPSGPVEVTTLRRDVSTDGRRATVAFSDDWREDAARRDFTINALYADPLSGEVTDYFGGVEDLAAGHVRFIGDALTRIAEDHLRILRFFRFNARFAKGAPDAEAMTACTARANDLMALSRERIAEEMLRILALPDPAPTLGLMVDNGILLPVLPEVSAEGVGVLARLVSAEAAAGLAPDPLRRLASLLPADMAVVDAIWARLKLSNAARKFLAGVAARDSEDAEQGRALAYWQGRDVALARVLLAGGDAAAINDWAIPQFPFTGRAVIARGISKGPEVARLLKQVETRWVAEGFPGATRTEAMLDKAVADASSEAGAA